MLVCAVLFTASIGHAQRLFHDGPVGPASIRIVLVGDSTVNNGGGWGPGFCALMTPNVDCVNLARNGRSSKSYYDESLWQGALAQHGDYVLVQFGHNDMPGKGPVRETDPETTYATNMRRYIQQARAAGAKLVIITSLSRRKYKDGKLVQDLAAYANAAKRVAHEEGVPVIDLNTASTKLLESMTQDAADHFDAETHPDAAGKGPDRTHLNPTGFAVFGRMVADGLAAAIPELRPCIKGVTLHVAADGSGDYTSVQKAIDDAPSSGGALVLVAPGTYREVLTIDKPNIQLRTQQPSMSRAIISSPRTLPFKTISKWHRIPIQRAHRLWRCGSQEIAQPFTMFACWATRTRSTPPAGDVPELQNRAPADQHGSTFLIATSREISTSSSAMARPSSIVVRFTATCLPRGSSRRRARSIPNKTRGMSFTNRDSLLTPV
jgi:lysophospholipase L1-like esterase